MSLPYLLKTQTDSYAEFLQEGKDPANRDNSGLEEVFKSIFPINSASGNAALDYISYELGECLYTPQECKMKGISYAVPLYANLQLRMMDKATGYKTIKENGIKEDRVFLGEIPVMTKDGSFVVNGTERVVVSQLHRSPGVFFDHDKGKTHASGKVLYAARIIPYRGSWLDYEFDAKDLIYARIDRKRKFPATAILKSLDMSDQEILDTFYKKIDVEVKNGNIFLSLEADDLKGKAFDFDIEVAGKKVASGKRVNAKVAADHSKQKNKLIAVDYDAFMGQTLGEDIINKETGEIYYKKPKLIELHECLYKTTPKNLHNSLIDVWVCWRSELLWKSISKLIGFNGYIIGFFILILSRLFSLIIPFLDYGTLYKPNFISYLVSAVLFMPIIYTFYSVKKFFGFKRAAGLDHFDQSYKNIPFEKRGIFKWFPNSMYMFGLLMPFAVAVLTGSKIMFIVGVYTYIGGWIHYFATEKPDINYIYKNKHEH